MFICRVSNEHSEGKIQLLVILYYAVFHMQ